MNPRDIYNGIGTLSDIELLVSDTDDGESHYLEFKQVKLNLDTANKADVGDFKLDVAKEMSAFANTDSGVIILGYDGKTKTVVNDTPNLQDWVDKNVADMIEPRLSGIMTKIVGDKRKNTAVVMHIPKGKAVPYRVASTGSYSKKKTCVREYYQRIGTNSIPIPEPIVRTMYRSSDSALDIEIFPKIIEAKDHIHESSEGRGFIRIGLFVKPDPTRLIEKYYLSSEAYLLDEGFRRLNEEPLTISQHALKDTVIPPTDELFELNTFDIRSEVIRKSTGLLPPPSIDTDNMDFQDTETISLAAFRNVFAIHLQTKYACDSMPMKMDNRIVVIGDRKNIDTKAKPEESYWIDEKCKVVRYISFGPNSNLEPMYAMEHYIGEQVNNET